jgi:glycerol-3-phosphate dehydrogenase (NAD(P)+)
MSNKAAKKAVVIGDGSWGTTLAILLAKNGVEVCLWSAFPEQSEELQEHRENKRFLPGVKLPENMSFSADPATAVEGAELAVSVVPTQFLRSVAERFEDAMPGTLPVVTATKGIEVETFQHPLKILQEVLGERDYCVLTGPSHAEEVARGLPASVVSASKNPDFAALVQATFNCDTLRVYASDDPEGAELAGALKNVIALAAGICDGLELGDNAKAALISRGMVEIARYGRSNGGKAETFFGLAGLGDLVTTCCSKHSRNRSVGEAIGRGETLKEILARMEMVAEGVWTTKALFGPESLISEEELPIAKQVHEILFEEKDVRTAVQDLMRRAPASEMGDLFGGAK